MNRTILNNIYNDMLELSSIDRQQDYWSGNNPSRNSSYTELMCRLFDDNNFDNFVDREVVNLNFDPVFVSQLGHLRDLLNLYNEEDESKIINDPQWHYISAKAAAIIETWPAI